MADLTEQQLLSTDPEVQGLQRQRQLANLLTGQAFNQPQGQLISGRYVAPSGLQQALPMINAAIGGLTNANLDTKQQQLAEALRGQKAEAFTKFQTLMANPQTRGEAMQYAAGNQYLQPVVADMMKVRELAPEAKLVMPSINGGAPVELATGGPKMSEAMRGYELAKQQGFGGTFVDYEMALKRAGAPSVSVTMDKGLAAQVGPMMKESKEKTIGAVKEIDAANQVIGALDSNKMFTGPLANTRLSAAQLGSTLGVGGKDVNEKINNTRAAIQGLAEITLQGRQEMRGQGAITESEGKLAERAKSGDISLTPGELKQLANAAKRAGEYTYNQHQAQLQAMAQNPETRQLIPYYNVGMMPQRQVQQAEPTTNEQLNIPATGGWRIK